MLGCGVPVSTLRRCAATESRSAAAPRIPFGPALTPVGLVEDHQGASAPAHGEQGVKAPALLQLLVVEDDRLGGAGVPGTDVEPGSGAQGVRRRWPRG